MRKFEYGHTFKSLKEMKDTLLGKTVTIVSNSRGSGLAVGVKCKVTNCFNPTAYNSVYVTVDKAPNGRAVYIEELKLGGDTIPDLEEEIADLEKEIGRASCRERV